MTLWHLKTQPPARSTKTLSSPSSHHKISKCDVIKLALSFTRSWAVKAAIKQKRRAVSNVHEEEEWMHQGLRRYSSQKRPQGKLLLGGETCFTYRLRTTVESSNHQEGAVPYFWEKTNPQRRPAASSQFPPKKPLLLEKTNHAIRDNEHHLALSTLLEDTPAYLLAGTSHRLTIWLLNYHHFCDY